MSDLFPAAVGTGGILVVAFWNKYFRRPLLSRIPIYVAAGVGSYGVGVLLDNYRVKKRRERLMVIEEYKKIHPEFFVPRDKCMRLKLSYLLLLLLLPLLIVAFKSRHAFSDILRSLSALPPWLQMAGVFSLILFLGFPLACGYMPVMLTSGYIFGTLPATAILSVSTFCSLLIATAVLQVCCRHRARSHLANKRPTLEAIVAALERPRMLTKLILLIRMAPIPFGVQNLIFSLTKIGRCKYAFLSWIGLLPNQLLHAAVGSSLREIERKQDQKQSPALRYLVFAIQVATSLSIITIIFRIAKKELNRIVRQESPGFYQV